MREIKFRAWDKEKSDMFPVDKIYFTLSGDIKGVKCVLNEIENHTILAENLTFMQYTGLKDKNGKDLYEGDIVSWFDEKWEIHYGGDGSYYALIDTRMIPLHEICTEETQIIGNIYQDSHLLVDKNGGNENEQSKTNFT